MTQSGFGWMLLAVGMYGLLHSVTASHTLKRLAEKWLGDGARRFYRLGYVSFALVSLLPVLALARWLPDAPLYTIPFPWALLMVAGEGVAGLGLLASIAQTDPWAFIGLRQIGSAPALVASQRQQGLVTSGLYRYVRHPIYTFSLLAIWLLPVVSLNVLALMTGLSAYIFVGIYFEERKLTAEFGEAYTAYCHRTPMLIPRLTGSV